MVTKFKMIYPQTTSRKQVKYDGINMTNYFRRIYWSKNSTCQRSQIFCNKYDGIKAPSYLNFIKKFSSLNNKIIYFKNKKQIFLNKYKGIIFLVFESKIHAKIARLFFGKFLKKQIRWNPEFRRI